MGIESVSACTETFENLKPRVPETAQVRPRMYCNTHNPLLTGPTWGNMGREECLQYGQKVPRHSSSTQAVLPTPLSPCGPDNPFPGCPPSRAFSNSTDDSGSGSHFMHSGGFQYLSAQLGECISQQPPPPQTTLTLEGSPGCSDLTSGSVPPQWKAFVHV